MDVQEALLTRRTVHQYRSEPIPDGALDRALLAAHHAPNHKMTCPWRFTRVGPDGRERLAGLYLSLKGRRRALSHAETQTYRAKMLNAAELLVVSQVRCDDAFRAKEDYAACACAIQNLMLSLHASGVGSKWTTGEITRHAQTYDIAQIGSDEEIIGFVWVGMTAHAAPPKRRPLSEVVRRVD